MRDLFWFLCSCRFIARLITWISFHLTSKVYLLYSLAPISLELLGLILFAGQFPPNFKLKNVGGDEIACATYSIKTGIFNFTFSLGRRGVLARYKQVLAGTPRRGRYSRAWGTIHSRPRRTRRLSHRGAQELCQPSTRNAKILRHVYHQLNNCAVNKNNFTIHYKIICFLFLQLQRPDPTVQTRTFPQ